MDDILVKTSQVPAETLIAHLNQFGLVTKPPEQLDGGTALGLKVLRNGRGKLAFTRGNEVPSVPEKLTRRGGSQFVENWWVTTPWLGGCAWRAVM